MEPFRRGKEPGHANKSHHERGRRPFSRDFLCSSLVLTSIRAAITPLSTSSQLELLVCDILKVTASVAPSCCCALNALLSFAEPALLPSEQNFSIFRFVFCSLAATAAFVGAVFGCECRVSKTKNKIEAQKDQSEIKSKDFWCGIDDDVWIFMKPRQSCTNLLHRAVPSSRNWWLYQRASSEGRMGRRRLWIGPFWQQLR